MEIAAHITFYYVESRLKYLEKVIEGLRTIKQEITIFIYTNRNFTLDNKYSNVKIVAHRFADNGHKKLNKRRRFYYQTLLKLGITKLVHPYYLTWINRIYVEKYIDKYDVQMYLEDDIYFDNTSLDYWCRYKNLCINNDYNLGFLRIEKDDDNNEFLTDLTVLPKEIITLNEVDFLLNDINPYFGFWIYEKSELKKFLKSKEWKFKFKNYGIRERSAIGWHGLNMKRYKGSLIPLVKNVEGSYYCDKDSTVHHLPNNYIGNHVFCQHTFPFKIEK